MRPRRCVEPEHDRHDRDRVFGGHRQAGQQARGADERDAFSVATLLQENGKRRKSEQRGQDVNEEHRREWEHERRHADGDSRHRAEAGLEQLDDPRHEQHEQHCGQHRGNEPEGPDHAERTLGTVSGAGDAGALGRDAGGPEGLVGREREERRAGSAYREVVPAVIREIPRLPFVSVDDRRAGSQRANERIDRALVPGQAARRIELRHHQRVGERQRTGGEDRPPPPDDRRGGRADAFRARNHGPHTINSNAGGRMHGRRGGFRDARSRVESRRSRGYSA